MRKDTKGKIAVIYARYSSHNQRDVSIEQQVTACRNYAESEGLSVIRIYDDHAISGTTDQRPQFQQMIHDSASQAFDYVIVYSLDRFSRDRYDSAIHKHTLKERGVKVLSAMEHISDDPTGTLMESILEGFAEYYSKELAQKIHRGMLSNAQKCIVLTRLPLGYDKGPDGKYQINEREAAIVREIYQRVAQGEAFVRIFEDFNSRGILTKKGCKWDRTSFNKILSNEKYIGVYTYGDLRIEDGIPPIIEKDLFNAVQEYVTQKPNARGNPMKRRRSTGVYLLTGKIFCGECKTPMIGDSGTSKSGVLHYYYTCKHSKGKNKTCHMPKAKRDYVEELVASQVKVAISDPDVAVRIADDLISYLEAHQETEEMVMLKNRLEDVRKQIKNIVSAIRQGIASTHLTAALSDLEAEESSLTAKLALARDRAKMDLTRGDVLALLETYCEGDIKDKAYQEKLIDAFVVKVFLYNDRLKVIVNFTGKDSNAIEVPFDVDTAEDRASESFEINAEDFAAECSDKLLQSPPKSTYPNTLQIYLICGLAVLESKIAARR